MTSLIMIPGLGSDFAVWQRTIDALGSCCDCTVGNTLSDDSLSGMAERILRDAPARFSLAGVSMGGMVALEIMRSAPERVARLALLDTNPCPDTPEQVAQRQRANAAVLASDNFEALAAGSLAYLIHPEASEDVRRTMIEMSVRVGAETYARQNTAVMARADQRPNLSTIAVPTTIIYGAQDMLTPVALSEVLRRGIRNSDVHLVPDCGHLPPIEQPETVAGLLREWMGRG